MAAFELEYKLSLRSFIVGRGFLCEDLRDPGRRALIVDLGSHSICLFQAEDKLQETRASGQIDENLVRPGLQHLVVLPDDK